jgi:predicted Zn-ribbon and HTH transcriptional regulator
MIREIIPDCGGQVHEVAMSMYRMWHCFTCGLEFSMKTRERPKRCPRCEVFFDAHSEQ